MDPHARRGRPSVPLALLAVAGLVALAPSVSAWSLAPEPPVPSTSTPDFDAVRHAWTLGMAPSAFPSDLSNAALATTGCALADVSGDGVADLLVLVTDPVNGTAQLRALAGPTFQDVLWRQSSTLDRVLRCAPDLDADGQLDPVLQLLGNATGASSGPAVDEARQQVQRILDGATGQALVGRVDPSSTTGAAAGSAATAQSTVSALMPAAEGTAAYLQTQASTMLAQAPAQVPPVPGAPPLDTLGGNVSEAASLQILDEAGAVLSEVSIAEAGVQPLALSPVPLTAALPDVAVLTRAGGGAAAAAGGVPQLALYAADGTQAWVRELPPSSGIPVLLPRAGDLDLDGVGDLIVSTAHTGSDAMPGAAYQVLSGVDGHTLFDSGPAVTGLVAAVPLGDVGDGPAVLQAMADSASDNLTLSALDGAGDALWSVELDALAVPVNAAIDPFTGDVLGFTDLTADGVPDVAVATQAAQGLVLQAVDGASGSVAWARTLADVDRVVPVDIPVAAVQDAAARAQQAAGDVASAAKGQVEDVRSGAQSALLAFGNTSTGAVLQLVDPLTGQVQWASNATLQAASRLSHLDVQAAGDLDADGIQDLVVTASFGPAVARVNTTAATADGRMWRPTAGNSSDGTGSAVATVSGASGQGTWTNVTESEGGAEPLRFQASSTAASASATKDGKDAPAVAPVVLALGVVGLATLRRRRRA